MSELERQEAEKTREAAEGERERRELLRRIGEGGPEQHVPGDVQTGRVEAEAQRIVAEQGRLSARALYVRMATIVALPLAFVALLPAVIGLVLLDRQSDQTNAVVRENRAILKQQAKETKTNREINKRQAAALSYLCETTSVLSLVIGQLERVDESFLGDPGLESTVKDKIRSRIRVYRVAQEEFARREPCQVIE